MTSPVNNKLSRKEKISVLGNSQKLSNSNKQFRYAFNINPLSENNNQPQEDADGQPVKGNRSALSESPEKVEQFSRREFFNQDETAPNKRNYSNRQENQMPHQQQQQQQPAQQYLEELPFGEQDQIKLPQIKSTKINISEKPRKEKAGKQGSNNYASNSQSGTGRENGGNNNLNLMQGVVGTKINEWKRGLQQQQQAAQSGANGPQQTYPLQSGQRKSSLPRPANKQKAFVQTQDENEGVAHTPMLVKKEKILKAFEEMSNQQYLDDKYSDEPAQKPGSLQSTGNKFSQASTTQDNPRVVRSQKNYNPRDAEYQEEDYYKLQANFEKSKGDPESRGSRQEFARPAPRELVPEGAHPDAIAQIIKKKTKKKSKT